MRWPNGEEGKIHEFVIIDTKVILRFKCLQTPTHSIVSKTSASPGVLLQSTPSSELSESLGEPRGLIELEWDCDAA